MTAGALLRRETAISVLLNAVISAFFCWLIFGGGRDAEVWGVRGVVIDTIPQGVMIGLMGTLVPGLIARRARVSGRLGSATTVPQSIAAIVRRSLATAVAAAIVAGAIAAALFRLLAIDSLGFDALLPLKVAGGAVIALLVTPSAIRAALN